ncbi:pentatricopeptide repeat-containing protein DOT4, chloroplastic [Cryptomeria japonica]|uniref:pentatricopeptide repeat-containing protein DOT4, chloroplastic n=1 Tax=Cryptomeria japonica TaxID=3369 RepID=UPI0027D9E2A0|nr:pentatricopeptide repeat-containing protein DOT4, chloroplastic [Cryptomeria japonica]
MPSLANLNLNLSLRTLDILLAPNTRSPPAESFIYCHLLHTCIAKNSLSEAKEIHSNINDNDRGFTFATHTFLQNTLLNMYDKCGSLLDARSIFNQMTETDVCSWNLIIAAYRRHKFPQQAFTPFYQMQRSWKNRKMWVSVRNYCDDSLIDMHAKCGNMQKARESFDKMSQRNVVSWNTMIAGYSQNDILDEALRLLKEIPQQNVIS